MSCDRPAPYLEDTQQLPRTRHLHDGRLAVVDRTGARQVDRLVLVLEQTPDLISDALQSGCHLLCNGPFLAGVRWFVQRAARAGGRVEVAESGRGDGCTLTGWIS